MRYCYYCYYARPRDSRLPYAPNLTAAVTADSKGGAELKTLVTQAADESASNAITIAFPSGLSPNAATLISCLSGTARTIGTATATSPLMPATLNGTVTIDGSALAPTLAITFPAPVNLSFNGAINLSSNSVTFSNVPDIPLTALSLDVTGVNGQRAFLTNCKPGNVAGSFTAQRGQTHTATAPISYTGCPASSGTGTGTSTGTGPGTGTAAGPSQKPKVSGSVSGLATGHPRLKFRVKDAGTAKIASVAVGLPGGLKFSRTALVSHKSCTTKGKKKCITTMRVKGLAISGGRAKSVVLKGGRLVITLKKAAAGLTITAGGPLMIESKSLETKVKHHKAGTLTFTFKVTTADHKSTLLTVKVKTH